MCRAHRSRRSQAEEEGKSLVIAISSGIGADHETDKGNHSETSRLDIMINESRKVMLFVVLKCICIIRQIKIWPLRAQRKRAFSMENYNFNQLKYVRAFHKIHYYEFALSGRRY
jgi:hypothetical protein